MFTRLVQGKWRQGIQTRTVVASISTVIQPPAVTRLDRNSSPRNSFLGKIVLIFQQAKFCGKVSLTWVHKLVAELNL